MRANLLQHRYVSVVIGAIVLGSACGELQAADRWLRVRGHSMAPAYRDSEWVRVTLKEYGSSASLNRGDVVAVQLKSRQSWILKRVVGIAGDELRWNAPSGKWILHGGKSEIEIPESPVLRAQLKRYGLRIPEGRLLLLGDARGSSLDSRQLGLFSTRQIVGVIGSASGSSASPGPLAP